jgi:hypothetical protein
MFGEERCLIHFLLFLDELLPSWQRNEGFERSCATSLMRF